MNHVNRLSTKIIVLAVVAAVFCTSIIMPICGEDKVETRLVHKTPLEFKQAVACYIKSSDIHPSLKLRHDKDKHASYKKELRYLFKNYGKYSANTLIHRIRVAHHEMVLAKATLSEEIYQEYEQLSSALLLICAQTLCTDVQNQIMSALQEIDVLLSYWRYQQQHQIKYFFSKSPIKWVCGKQQHKEIACNIIRLERKQKELYEMLGTFAAHMHAFAEQGLSLDGCYNWIASCMSIVACIKVPANFLRDDSRFDAIASQLELKLKSVYKFKSDCVSALAVAKKPNHFVRHWIAYASLMAFATHAMRYHRENPEVLPKVMALVQSNMTAFLQSVIVDPLTDLWRVFFVTHTESSIKSIDEKVAIIEKTAGILESKINELTADQKESLKTYSLEMLGKVLERMEQKGFTIDKDGIMEEVIQGNFDKLSKLTENTSIYYYDEKVDLATANVLLMIDSLLNLLQKYPELIDEGILPLLQNIGLLFADVGTVISDLLKNNFWTMKLAAFTPLAGACFGTAKVYQWATHRDYSPIRIALADINSLLIEAELYLDDRDYGKLLYLIHKLKHRSIYIKDSQAEEFLADVIKLESKRYSAQAKRGIVENMFNKYAFLGRIAI